MNRFHSLVLQSLLRRQAADPGPVQLNRKNVFLLPSKFGCIYLLIVLGMLLGAVNYANNLAYAMAFMIAALGLVSMLHTFRNLTGLSVSPGPARPVFAGQPLRFAVHIQETGARTRSSLWLHKNKTWFPLPLLHPLQTADGHVILPTRHRGTLELGRCSLTTYYPLGLFKAWSTLYLQTSALVYPKPAPRPTWPRTACRHSGADSDQSYPVPGLEDFQDLRAYQPGESSKRIDWKAYAREQGLLVKRFASGSSRTVWFDFQSIPHPDPETRLSILCALILEAHNTQTPYGLLLPGLTIQPDTGLEHRHTCLKALALFEAP
jgi:uncharacterized protein (DUF58 family)